MVKSILIVGVGGQGTLLASKIMGAVFTDLGYDVKVSEVHGMSQRGGSVVTYVKYGEKVFFFFGRESVGLPEELLLKYPEKCVRIPMKAGLRSLNQSNSAAIAAYEYLRQKDFPNLSDEGGLI